MLQQTSIHLSKTEKVEEESLEHYYCSSTVSYRALWWWLEKVCIHQVSLLRVKCKQNATYLVQQGKSRNFWPLPKFSPSCRVCGNSLSNVSGRKRAKSPPTTPRLPNTNSGSIGLMLACTQSANINHFTLSIHTMARPAELFSYMLGELNMCPFTFYILQHEHSAPYIL